MRKSMRKYKKGKRFVNDSLCTFKITEGMSEKGGGMDGDGKRKKIEHAFEGLVALGVKTVDVNPIHVQKLYIQRKGYTTKKPSSM